MTDLEQMDLWEEKLAGYTFGLTMIDLDADQRPPEKGNSLRARGRSALAAEKRRVLADPAIRPVLSRVALSGAGPAARRASLLLGQLGRTDGVPEEAAARLEKATEACARAWREHRFGSWKQLCGPFRELTRAQRAVLAARNGGYDLLLSDREPGWDTARYDAFFDEMKRRVLPLIRRQPSAPPKDAGHFPAPLQRKGMCAVAAFLGLEPSWCRIGESAHPLTTFIASGDVRLTIRYREEDPSAAILSLVHEGGHAWYAHNIDPAFDGTVLSSGISAAMHESQARLCENHFGRNRAFWQVHLPALEALFPGHFRDLDSFMKALNASRPGPLRTVADELTYPVHILIRYEIEKLLFSGQIEPEEMDGLWNRKMEEYLGVSVRNDAEGILQDMHWPYAYFGYFPTYALGSAYAAQFFRAMEKDLPVDLLLSRGRYTDLMEWLGEHVHRSGCLYDADELLKKATGSTFDPEFYFSWLEERFG